MIDYEKILNEHMWVGGKLSAVDQGKRFLNFILLKLFDRTETDLENNDINEGVLYTDGCGDYGIDSAFVDGDTLYIIQGKYRKDHSYENVYHFLGQIRDFFNLKNAREVRRALVDVYNCVYSDDINEIKVFYVTNNWIEAEYEDYQYKTKCEDFNQEYSQKLEKKVTLSIVGFEEYNKIHTGIILDLPKEAKTAESRLNLAKFFENRDRTSVVAEVALKDLARLVQDHSSYIFSSNIRNYKGLNNINKGIKDTYENHPKNFWYYNNGITIVCNDYEVVHDSFVKIRAPQIVNGCQTATTIYNCWSQSDKTEKNTIDGTILVKIIKDSNLDKRKNITRYTNSQTAVTGKDFFALEAFHAELQKSFKEIGYFYEIQSNSAKLLTIKYRGCDKYRHFFDGKFKNSFSAKEITQTYIASLLNMPAKAKNIGQFMPGCDKYEKVFNSKASTDCRFYLLPYGVWYYLKKVFVLPNNSVIDNDKWTASLLFTTNVFFKVISEIYNHENYSLNSEEFISICDEKMSNKEVFEKLVRTTYNVMRDFYSDSSIKEKIGDNLPKFLKSAIESDSRVNEILLDKISLRKEEFIF